MTKTTKAMLLSALVFPGAGHFLLKKPVAGMVLAAAALASLCFIVAKMVQRTMGIVDQVLQGQVQPDVATLAEMVSKTSAGAGAGPLNIAWAVLILVWVISIADAYRLGRSHGTIEVGQ